MKTTNTITYHTSSTDAFAIITSVVAASTLSAHASLRCASSDRSIAVEIFRIATRRTRRSWIVIVQIVKVSGANKNFGKLQ